MAACMSCFSGLFTSGRSGARQPERPKEDLLGVGCGAVGEEQQPLAEPAGQVLVGRWVTQGRGLTLQVDVEPAGAPADKAPADGAEETPSTSAQSDQGSHVGIPGVQPAEPEPAAGQLAHFEGSDAEDGGRAARRGCCVPRRRRSKGTKAAKKCEDEEATPTADLAKADGSPEVADGTMAAADA